MILNGVRYPRLRKQGKSFYFDDGGKPRHWDPLGTNEARAIARWRELSEQPKPVAGTVAQMLKETLDAMARRTGINKLASGTLLNYRGYKKHLEAVFDRPEDITQADVLKYLRACPRMSFRNEIGFLSLGYVHWMDEGRLTFNPCFGVHIKRAGSKRDRIFTAAELDAIIGKADERLAVAIELAYATGLRIGDCCRLGWADIAEIVETQKTGVRQAYEQTDVLGAILTRARALQARIASLYVLCDRRGRKWTTGWLRSQWDAACAAAGVENAHFHDIRATAGSEVGRREGQEAARIFLGHKDIRTTIGYLRDKRPNVVRPLARKVST